VLSKEGIGLLTFVEEVFGFGSGFDTTQDA
jgi:hypothetical protein